MDHNNRPLLSRIQHMLEDNSVTITESLQSLWSGYGQIVRCFSDKKQQSYVVKMVSPPSQIQHPRGWNTPTSHQRKLTSYQVESTFYQEVAAYTDKYCKVPQLLAYEHTDEVTLLVMEDLDEQGYVVRIDEQQGNALELALRWLAYFHARFWHREYDGIWPVGSYWHLSTRRDEWQNMPEGLLKKSAKIIDERLNNAKFKTIIHGDAKFANFCFHQDGSDVAAVDFQYVGYGSPVKDLAYLIAGCLSEQQLLKHEHDVLARYFTHLEEALTLYGVEVDFEELRVELSELYCFAWADFYRFLEGWNPNSHKISQYMQNQTAKCLALLQQT